MATRTPFKIGVVAAGSPITRSVERQVTALVASAFPSGSLDIFFHPQCFETAGHFAGNDQRRTDSFLQVANDPCFHAVWFARGGYGACRLVGDILPALSAVAADKHYLGYSDAACILAALYKSGFPHIAHGPMPHDISRSGGEAAVMRALNFLTDPAFNEFELTASHNTKTAAFNISVLCHLLNTPFLPDLSDHILMLEDLSETAASIDGALCAITHDANVRRVAGIKLGRCPIDNSGGPKDQIGIEAPVPNGEGDAGAQEMVQHWCRIAGIKYLGRADIGHDVDNRVVPFGLKS